MTTCKRMRSGHTMPTNAIINSMVTGKWLIYIFKTFKGHETNLLYQRPEGYPSFLRGNVWEEERGDLGFHIISHTCWMMAGCGRFVRLKCDKAAQSFLSSSVSPTFHKEFKSQGTTAGVSPGALPSELPSCMHSSKMYLVK